MGLFEHWPYTNFHELNLNWIICKMKELSAKVDVLAAELEGVQSNIKAEVLNVLTAWKNNGTMTDLLSDFVDVMDTNGLNHIAAGEAVAVGFIGDSITYGYDPNNSGDPVANPYPAILESRLQSYNINVTVHNYGVSGAASGSWETQYESARADGCTVISFMFGHNDFRLGYSVNTVMENVSAFIQRCHADGVTPIVASQNPYLGTTVYRPEKSRALAEAIKAECESSNAFYVPVYEGLDLLYNSGMINNIELTPDGVHMADYSPVADIYCGSVFSFICVSGRSIINGWRDLGNVQGNTTMATISGLIGTGTMRLMNIKADSTVRLAFYSEKPFKLATITADDASSAVVDWELVGMQRSGWCDNPASMVDSHDYYQAISVPEDITALTRTELFSGNYFAPGFYVLRMVSLNPGPNVPVGYTPLLYLASIAIEKADYHYSTI